MPIFTPPSPRRDWPVGARLRVGCPLAKGLLLITVGALLAPLGLRAQLAITEAMSWASTNCTDCGVLPRGCHPDFFELTNFGTNTLNLKDYQLADRDAIFPEAAWVIPDDIYIRPGESVIFSRDWPEVSTPGHFRDWWGTQLPPDLQVVFYPRNYGFDQLGDALRVWDPLSNVVDQVFFGETRRGVTFDYDPETGAARQSTNGVDGAFVAEVCGDVGSPGWAPAGPVPIRLTRQPVSQSADAGGEVVFAAEATGLPRPLTAQWYHNGVSMPIPVTRSEAVPVVANFAGCGVAWRYRPQPTDLVLTGVQAVDAGQYYVVFANGLERATSAVVTLSVNTAPTPPRVECPPAEWFFPAIDGRPPTNLTVALLQTARFEVIARGYPTPALRWSWSADGRVFTDLPGATNQILLVAPALPGHAGIYRVRLQNTSGTNDAYAALTVVEKPDLKITEVMSDSSSVYEDWWELTNVGAEPVDLYGYRWDDRPGDIGGGPTVSRSVIVQPGESVIFLEGRTPEFFIDWWGADHLPAGLQFIRHTANGLEAEGDELNLWNSTATDPLDWIDSVVFASSPGRSVWFAPRDPCSEFGVPSMAGECAAFTAARGSDVGSPGWTPWTPPRLTSVRRTGSGVALEWKAQPGSVTAVLYADVLAPPGTPTVWRELGDYPTTRSIGTATDTNPGNQSQRFYRLQVRSPANCPCPNF